MTIPNTLLQIPQTFSSFSYYALLHPFPFLHIKNKEREREKRLIEIPKKKQKLKKSCPSFHCTLLLPFFLKIEMVKMPQISSAKYTRDTEVMKGREKGEKETLECQVLTQKISLSPFLTK